jgi:hypothetical protein
MDNHMLEKIYQARNLTKAEKDILLALCRTIFHQSNTGVVQTEWWAAAPFIADEVNWSERTVRRAYKSLERKKVLTTSIAPMQTKDKDGNQILRNTIKVKFNTKLDEWKI